MKRVLLISLNWGHSDDMGAMTHQAMALPLEFVYMSTELSRLGVEHAFVDCWAHDYSMEDIREQISRSHIVVFCSSPSYVFWRDGVINIRLVTESARAIKQINPDVVSILVGPHGTVVPESFDGLPIDYLFRGEPDLMVPQLIAQLNAGHAPPGDLPGVMRQENGRFVGASIGVQVQDLDTLAPLDWSKFTIAGYPHPPKYGAVPDGRLAVLYEASRGCPYSCIYCFKVNFRDTFRAKSLTRIEQELRTLASQNVGYVYLIDEIFFKDRAWSTGVMQLLKQFNIRFGCQTRPALLTRDMVDAIIDHGMAGLIQIGLEHTDAEVLKTMRKGDTNLQSLGEQLHRLADAGVSIDIFLVTGLPGDSRDKILAMREVFQHFPLRHITFISHGAMPLPGTKLWQMGKDAGLDLQTWDDVSRFKGLIGTTFATSNDMDVAAFQLAGQLKALEDRSNIEAGVGGYFTYLKLVKHRLDGLFPRAMQAATALKMKLRA